MQNATVRCTANNGDGFRNVATFEPVWSPDESQAQATLSIVVLDEDGKAGEDFEVGAHYSLSLSQARGADKDDAANLAAAVAAIPNSTNTRHYKTPAELKVPPPPVPDGVVTEPKPAVVLPPMSDTPPTAGVVSPGAEASTPSSPTTSASTGGGGSASGGGGGRRT